MKRLGWGRCAMLAAVAILLAVPATADLAGWVTVTRRAGTVESQLAGSNTWVRIATNRKLGKGATVKTLAASAAELRLADNSIMAMGANTSVSMDRFDMSRRQRDSAVTVTNGAVRSKVSRFTGGRSRFEVSTPNAVLAAQGTDFLVTVINPDETGTTGDGWVQAQGGGGQVITQAAVFEGVVTMQNGQGQEITLRAGDTGQVVGDGPPESNPSSFDSEQATEQTDNDPGLRDVPDPGDALFIPYDYSTIYEHFGSNETGLTGNTRRTSTGQPEDGFGAPPLINPQAETTGTLIIELQP